MRNIYILAILSIISLSVGCGPAVCKEDTDCTPIQICEAQSCEPRCETGKCDKGKYCASDGRCQEGCTSNDNCQAETPTCNTSEKKCVMCINSEDCKGDHAGYVCDQKTCRKCADDKECETPLTCNKDGKCTENKATCPNTQVEYPEGSGKCHDTCETLACDKDNRTCKDQEQIPACDVCKDGFTEDANKKCVPSCKTNLDCQGGQACINSLCTPCTKDEDCNQNDKEVCESGICKKPGDVCPSGQIEFPKDSGKCVDSCATLKCQDAFRKCDDTNPTGQCGDCLDGYKSKTTGGTCEKKCVSDTDCQGGQICKDELCQACTASSECFSGEGSCKAGKCERCAADTDCETGKECDTTSTPTVCRTKCPNGFQRDPGTKQCVDACKALDCDTKNRTCDKTSTPIQCGSCYITHVEDPQTKTCVTKCSNDNDCTNAQKPLCRNDICTGCTNSTDCPSTQVCDSGACKANPCQPPDQVFNPTTKTCVPSCTKLGCAALFKECLNEKTNPSCGGCLPTHELKNGTCQPKSCSSVCNDSNQLCEGTKCINVCKPGYAWDPTSGTNGACVTTSVFCSGRLGTGSSTAAAQYLETNASGQYIVETIPNPNWNNTTYTEKYIPICVPKVGYYATLVGSGSTVEYGVCDHDGDGWVGRTAYRFVEDSRLKVGGIDKPYKKYVKCIVHKVEHIAYRRTTNIHNDGQFEFIESLPPAEAFELWETDRNDGHPNTNQADKPTFPKDQNPKNGKTLFAPAAINSFTKACAPSVDLNDNGENDYEETPITKVGDFQVFLKWSYYTELAYGYFVPTAFKSIGGKSLPNVYVIQERDRTKTTANAGLPLSCTTTGTNEYWRQCILRDDQVCNATPDQGRSQCWHYKTDATTQQKIRTIKRGLPSLFKCVHFLKEDTPKFYDTTKHGTNYTRHTCSLSTPPSKVFDKGLASERTDSVFTCAASTSAPKEDDVGWACRGYEPHTKSSTEAGTDYKAGCVQECTDNNYDASKPTDSLLACPGTRVLGDKICKTDPSNYGKGSCDLFLHYGHIGSVGCAGSTGCSPVSKGGDFVLYDASFTGTTMSYDANQPNTTGSIGCAGVSSVSGATLCLYGGFSSEGP
ncbi:MAG: hypothetical protein CL920_26795 [Deltaproteobacteria bacterium]|nr:hypothetical protein [Deltaproteobacteria bacterium]